MKHLRMLLIVVLVLGFATVSFSLPVINIAGDNFEDRSNGSVFGFYANSGTLLFTSAGNNVGNAGTLANVQNLVRTATGDSALILTMSINVAFTLFDNNSGTWGTIPPLGPAGTIDFYAVKAGNAFAMYELDPAAATGSWSTFDIWNSGLQGTGGNGGLQISHFTGYNPGTTSVPEPGMLLMFGAGLLGLGLFGRKKFRK